MTDITRQLAEALEAAHKALEAISDEMTVGERYTNAGQYLIDSLEPVRSALAAWREQQAAPAAQPPAVELPPYGSTDFGWTYSLGRELEPQEKRLMSLLVSAFGSDHPAVDDMAYLMMTRSAALASKRAVPNLFDVICNAIKTADDETIKGDYMLDSDDCIRVVRTMQALIETRQQHQGLKP